MVALCITRAGLGQGVRNRIPVAPCKTGKELHRVAHIEIICTVQYQSHPLEGHVLLDFIFNNGGSHPMIKHMIGVYVVLLLA